MSERYQIVRDTGRRPVRVSVGMNTYNGGDQPRVDAMLRSYEATVGQRDDVSLTLLDDGSPRASAREALVAWSERLDASCLLKPVNGGITAAWNDLSRFVPEAEFIVLLNDDLVLTPKWLDNLIYFLERNDCGAVGLGLWFCVKSDLPALVAGVEQGRYFGSESIPVVPRDPLTKQPKPELGEHALDETPGVMMCAPGCAFGFRRSVFNTIGGFDEAMKQTHNESDFGTAAAAIGLPSYVAPWPKAWHLWSATFRENPEVSRLGVGDREAYVAKWGGHFDFTHPRFMLQIPPREVFWRDREGNERSRVLEIR